MTGSSRGIGAAIAKRLAQECRKVVVHGRDVVAMTAAQVEIEQIGRQAIHVSADVTPFTDTDTMRQEVECTRYERLTSDSLEQLKLADKALGRTKGD